MDPLSQLTHTLLDGADQGTARAVSIGTSANAAAAWDKITTSLRPRRHSLDLSEREVLAAEPGEEIDLQALLRLLRMLSPDELMTSMTVHGDYIARDKNVRVDGDWIGRDKY